MTRFRFTLAGLALLVALFSVASTAGAASVSSTPSSYAGVAATTDKPRANVKLTQCVGSPLIDSRKIVFTARTWIYGEVTGGQKRQMRFDLFRKFDEHKKFRRVRAAGLSTWTDEGETAVIDQRELSLNGLDTAARYYVKVSFRWYDAAGATIVARKQVTSKVCALKDRLPDLVPLAYERAPIPGSADGSYRLRVMNRGGSETRALPVIISIDGGQPVPGTIDELVKGDSVFMPFQAGWCSQSVSVKFDPARTQRIAPRARQVFTLPC